MLPTHGRYAYAPWPERARYAWPGGAKLAVYLGVNLEHFAFGEGLGAELAPGGPQPDVLNYAWRDYGNRVGGWRLIELLDQLALPATVLLNSAMYDHAPQLVAAHRARGDEMAGHGRTNSERQSTLPEPEERALIAASTAALRRHEKVAPRGWLKTRAGRLLAIPYPQELNDIPAIAARKDGAEQFAAMVLAEFEERLEQVGRDGIPQVMGIALHPYIVGHPYRLRALRRALAAIAARRGEVWITTAGGVLDHVATLPEGAVP